MAKDYIHLKMDATRAYKWLNNAKEGIGNLKPLFTAIEPSIRSFAKAEFTSQNPNSWKQIDPKYRQWKVKHGLSPIIGVMGGRLKWAASDGAKIKISRNIMQYKLDDTIPTSKTGHKYAKDFDKKRKIFKHTALRVKSFIQGVTVKFVNAQIRKAKP